ncbi:MAG: hypothetical protein JNM74_27635 [Myxococcales bacterium]|nr:hypothetical protein [Myxococcales bacterium]
MSDVDDDKLPDDLADWLGAAKEVRGPSPEVRARMTSRMLAALPVGPGGGGGGTTSSPTPPARPAALPGMPQIPAWIAAATFVLGMGAGALVTSGPTAPPKATESLAPTSAQSALAALPKTTEGAASGGSSTLRPEDLPAASVAPPPSKPSATPSRAAGGSDLSAERAVLDVARTALGRGDPAHALASTDEHARRFPRGALSEEREAIAVQALAQSGRADEARSRALRFKKDHPESILLPAVLAAGAVP